MSYDVVRQGVDVQRVFLLLLKWPIYAFALLRRGRFETIAQLRMDAYQLTRASQHPTRRMTRGDSEDFIKAVRSTLGNGTTAITWAVFLALVLVAERIVPELQAVLSTSLVVASCLTILVGLSSIVRESSTTTNTTTSTTGIISSVLAGIFFVASTLPFSLPWVIAFFFPRQCLLFFTTWAVFGAIVHEVSVLVSHARLIKGVPLVDEKKQDDAMVKNADIAIVFPEPSPPQQQRGRPKRRQRKTTEQRIATVSNFTVEDRKDLEDYIISDEGLKWWAAFLAMQTTISVIAVFLRLIFVDTNLFTSSAENPAIVSFALLMSLSMLCESFWMTHAVGGRWLNFRNEWRFFQPSAGGQKFATMQCVAWTLFFAFLIMSLADLRTPSREAFEIFSDNVPEWGKRLLDDTILGFFETVTKMLRLDRLPRGTAALFGIFAELIMLVSLPMYQGPTSSVIRQETLDEVLEAVVSDEHQHHTDESKDEDHHVMDPQIKHTIEALRKRRLPAAVRSQFSVPLWELAADALRTAWLSPIVLTLVKPEVTLFLTGFVLSKFVHGASFFGLFNIHLPYLICGMQLAYLPTYFGNPRKTGHRRWWKLRGTWFFDELSAYWYTNLVREKELNAREKHIFGYHPHGMFPMGASYLHNTKQWMDLFPHINPFTLTATITHIVPLLREVTQYNGGVEVTQESFANALLEFRNVMLVPGGQHEMLLSTPDDPNETPLSSKHKGFVRLALLSAAEHPDEVVNLVPIYAFGESDMLYNAFPASLSLQRWMVSKLRLNPAFLPVGRFNLAGVPKRVPITFVVGSPIRVPVVNGVATEEQVELLAARYYSAVEETFEKHKLICDRFGEDSRVTFVPPLDGRLSQKEFELKWQVIGRDNAGSLHERKKKRDPLPIPEYIIAIAVANLSLWVPYFVFAN